MPAQAYLMDVKPYGQILPFAFPSAGPFGPLLDADKDLILRFFHIKDVLAETDKEVERGRERRQ